MPKIIENLPQRLMDEARRQILESGYSAMTIRSVASGCGVGIGTVYNYYPSKDDLVAAFLMQEWDLCLAAIQDCAQRAQSQNSVLMAIHDQLLQFIRQHAHIFRDPAAGGGFAASYTRHHALLRNQLAAPLRRFCRDDFTAEFIAEAALTWTVEGKDFDALRSILLRLF